MSNEQIRDLVERLNRLYGREWPQEIKELFGGLLSECAARNTLACTLAEAAKEADRRYLALEAAGRELAAARARIAALEAGLREIESEVYEESWSAVSRVLKRLGVDE